MHTQSSLISGEDFDNKGLSSHCNGQSRTKENADNVLEMPTKAGLQTMYWSLSKS